MARTGKALDSIGVSRYGSIGRLTDLIGMDDLIGLSNSHTLVNLPNFGKNTKA